MTIRKKTTMTGEELFTFFRKVQYPLNCSVAPNKESIKLPHSPAAAAIGTTSNCLRAILGAHSEVRNPTRTKVSPMTKPAAAAARNPSTVTAPFVPFLTF